MTASLSGLQLSSWSGFEPLVLKLLEPQPGLSAAAWPRARLVGVDSCGWFQAASTLAGSASDGSSCWPPPCGARPRREEVRLPEAQSKAAGKLLVWVMPAGLFPPYRRQLAVQPSAAPSARTSFAGRSRSTVAIASDAHRSRVVPSTSDLGSWACFRGASRLSKRSSCITTGFELPLQA